MDGGKGGTREEMMDGLSDVKDRSEGKRTRSLRRERVEVSSSDKGGFGIQACESGEAETGALR